MSPSTNTCSGPTTSTESTTTYSSELPYVTQTDFVATIKDLLSKFKYKFKEYLKETISDQYAKFYAKFEKQIHTLSLQIKDISLKHDDQDKKISSFTESYN